MMKLFLIPALAIFCILISCRSTRNIQTAISKKDTTAVVAPVIADDHGHDDSIAFIRQVYDRLQKQHIDYTTFSAKIDVDFKDGESKTNVTAHVRMYKDSIIWVSITAILGFEGLRAVITPDSVKILNKQDKIYTARSVAYLQEVSDLPLDLSSLQELLIGNRVFLDSNIVSYERSNGNISLTSIGEFFKNLLTLSEGNYQVQSSKLDDLDEGSNRTSYLSYDDYENKNGINFPTRRSIHVTEKKNLEIELNFKQFDFNETLSFPFSIPKNYKRN